MDGLLAVGLTWLSLVANVAKHLGVVTVTILALSLCIWGLVEDPDWSPREAIRLTSSAALLTIVVGFFVYIYVAKG